MGTVIIISFVAFILLSKCRDGSSPLVIPLVICAAPIILAIYIIVAPFALIASWCDDYKKS